MKGGSGIFRTLRGRLTLLACLATLPAFLFVLYAASQERKAVLGRAESEARYVASLASREHAHQVAGAEHLLSRLGSLYAGSRPGGLEPLRKLLPAILSGFPQFANLGILDSKGALAFSVVAPPRPVDMSANVAFTKALQSKDVVMGPYQMGAIVGRPILILAQAIRDDRGGVQGVLFAALDLAWLDQLASQAKLPPEYALLIADREGRVLARSGGSGRLAAEEGERLPAFEPLLQPDQHLLRRRGLDGLPRLFTAAPMEGVPDLFVAVGLPEDRVIGAANRAFLRAVVALAALALLAVASSVAAADLTVLWDLRLLARATHLFGSGHLAARAPIPRTRGEIRDLALAFNGMADALEARDREATAAQEQLRALSHRLQAAREEEGARISRELHDQLGQELTALKLDLSGMKRAIQEHGQAWVHESLNAWLDHVNTQIDACVDSVRRISSELRPSVLDRLGLVPALEWIAREFERRTGLCCAFRAHGPREGIDPQVSTALFRIAQEALTNILRHASATSVRVDLHREGGLLTLRIKDDGKGCEGEGSGSSLGVLGMRERAHLVGGTLQISGIRGQGTEVVARVPLTPPQAAE